MNSLINFIIESSLSVCLFTLIYVLLLQQETYFRNIRFFLLFALIFSNLLPLLHFPIWQQLLVNEQGAADPGVGFLLETVVVYGNNTSRSVADYVSTNMLIVAIYLVGVFVCLSRLIYQLNTIYKIIRGNEVVFENGVKLVVHHENISPFSFLSYVFVTRNFKEQNGWEKILQHESEHVAQRHTIDILILEIFFIIQWFNPFFWLLRRKIKENHEYLADKAVCEYEQSPSAYMQILISYVVGRQLTTGNSFDFLIKKRIKMMTKIKSSKLATLKLFSGIILVLALIVVFACEDKSEALNESAELIPLKSTETESVETNGVLLLIDGEVYNGDINQVGRSIIESINVIKSDLDEYITKYGDAAKNGVIEIKLKDEPTSLTQENAGTRNVELKNSTPQDSLQEQQVFVVVEEMPRFPGGEVALREYLEQNIRYPSEAKEAGIHGKVYVSFVVEADGSIDRVKIIRGVDERLDNEAIRVISGMPNWTPGKQGGQPVAVSYTLPISFVLQ